MTPVPRLSVHLQAVAGLLPDGAVADVGAGHGALAATLATTGRRVIATDAEPGPFAELRINLARWGLLDAVDCRLGRDLEPLVPGEVEGVVVTGLGARTILGALAGAPAAGVSWAAFQCWQRAHLVEPWLAARGWEVLGIAEPVDHGRVYPTWLVLVGA